jgi:hypothetical protein
LPGVEAVAVGTDVVGGLTFPVVPAAGTCAPPVLTGGTGAPVGPLLAAPEGAVPWGESVALLVLVAPAVALAVIATSLGHGSEGCIDDAAAGAWAESPEPGAVDGGSTRQAMTPTAVAPATSPSTIGQAARRGDAAPRPMLDSAVAGMVVPGLAFPELAPGAAAPPGSVPEVGAIPQTAAGAGAPPGHVPPASGRCAG